MFYEFNFSLQSNSIEPVLSKDKLSLLFQKIIITLGIGAKTNVGYGQFSEQLKNINNVNNNKKDVGQQKIPDLNHEKNLSNIKMDDVLNAIVQSNSGGVTIDLGIRDITFKPRLIGVSPADFPIGKKIKVKVTQIGKSMKFVVAD